MVPDAQERGVMQNKFLAAFLIMVLAALGAARVSAQVDVLPGVARVSVIGVRGDVSIQRGDSGDWAATALNQPVVAGDKVSTGADSRAEVQLDYANILRLADNSLATIANLTNHEIQIQIGQGLADYVVLKRSEASVEIDTPNVAVHSARHDGVYRVEINADGETRVMVRVGEAEISTPQGSTRLEKGQAATIRGTADQAVYKIDDAPAEDRWDAWNDERNHVIYRAQSWNHTNRYYTGSEDLDGYGRWVNVPDYGLVWQPAVAADWVPYRDGRWLWEPYWGWTWVSYEPWGWAPYHYGRWFVHGGSWVWWPGPVYRPYRPIWAPAYVSFFGFGGNGGVSVGFGSVGWLPCGPGDTFFPWYGEYRSRFNVVNVTKATNITNLRNVRGFPPLRASTGASNLRMLSNERMIRGVSTVPANRFGTGRVTALPATHEMLRDRRLVAGNLPILPTRENLSATNRPASLSTIRSGHPQRFFEKARPAAAQPFDTQAAQLQQAIQCDGKFTPIRAAAGAETQKPSPILAYRSTPENPSAAVHQPGKRMHVPTKVGTAEVRNPVQSGTTMRFPSKISTAEVNRRTSGESGGRGSLSFTMTAETPHRSSVPVAPERGWQQSGSLIAKNQPPQNSQRNLPKPPSPARRAEQLNNIKPAASDQSGWHRFGDGGQGGGRNVSPAAQPKNRGFGNGSVPRPEPRSGMTNTSPTKEASPNRGEGWHKFTPQSRLAMPEPNRGGSEHWNRFPTGSGSNGMGSPPRND